MNVKLKSIGKVSIMMLIGTLSFNAIADLDDINGATCEYKKQILEKKINKAKELGNLFQIEGLETALNYVNTNCDNKDLESKYKKKIKEKTDDVSERLADLKKAEQKNDTKKIAKYKYKLSEKQNELKNAQDQLTEFYNLMKK